MDYYGQQNNSNFYGTTIDPNAANFGNPMNSANMNQGFGINPALLTPSYQAAYRPHVALQAGYSPYGNPSFSRATYNAFGPGKDPTWGNPHDSMQPSVQSMATKPLDAAAWVGQNVALPAAMYSAAGWVMGPLTSPNWSFQTAAMRSAGQMAGSAANFAGQGAGHVGNMFGRSWGQGWGAGWGGAAQSSTMWSEAGMASRMSGNFMTGLSRGMGLGAGATEAMGTAGALVGGTVLPFMLGYQGLQVANKLVFSQYINSRQNANNLHRNFSNVYMGDGGGDTITGKGLSYAQSASIGTQISSLGNNDRMFSQSDYSQIFDMSSRAGLYDDVKSKGIVKRTKEIAEQIKMIVAISKDPSVQSAIEQISSLKIGGAGSAGSRTSMDAYSQMGSYAAQAGMSIQRVMSGVGAQGQYMFQANGMTPYLGQLAAANSLAGFSAAQRTGLMSNAALARSGGIEGAAQGSLTAQVLSSQTPYAMMGSYNRILSGLGGNSVGGPNQSLVSTVGAFGASVARDPLSAIGNMALHGQAMAGADMAIQGPAAAANNAISLLRSMGQKPGDNGKYTAQQVAAAMQSGGIPASNIRDYISEMRNLSDPDTANVRISAIRGNAIEQARAAMNQQGSGGGAFDSLVRGISRRGGALMDNAAESFVNPVVRGSGAFGEAVNRTADWWGFSSIKNNAAVGDISTEPTNAPVKLIDVRKLKGENRVMNDTFRGSGLFDNKVIGTESGLGIVEKINKLALSGNPDAQGFVRATTVDERKVYLEKLSRSNLSDLGDVSNRLSLEGGIAGIQQKDVSDNIRFISELPGKGAAVTYDGMSTNTDRRDFLDSASHLTDIGDRKTRTSTQGIAELQVVGAAGILADIKNQKNLSAPQLLELARNNKTFSGVLKLAEQDGKPATGDSLATTIEDLQKNAAVEGYRTSGDRIARDLTYEQATGLTEEQQRSRLKGLGPNIKDITSQSRRSVESMDNKTIQDDRHRTLNNGKSMQDLQDAVSNNNMSFKDFTAIAGKVDSATEFRLGVDKFLVGVEKFVGKDSGISNVQLFHNVAKVFGVNLDEKNSSTTNTTSPTGVGMHNGKIS